MGGGWLDPWSLLALLISVVTFCTFCTMDPHLYGLVAFFWLLCSVPLCHSEGSSLREDPRLDLTVTGDATEGGKVRFYSLLFCGWSASYQKGPIGHISEDPQYKMYKM